MRYVRAKRAERSGPSADKGLDVDIVHIVVGVAVVAASGLVLSAAIRRVVRGVALLFAGAAAFVAGGYLILSGLWRVIRSRRRSRNGPRRVMNTLDQADL